MIELDIWVVYKNPLDAPGKFVVRKWINDSPTETKYIEDTLEDVRDRMPEGLVNIGRQPYDDPKIVEAWI